MRERQAPLAEHCRTHCSRPSLRHTASHSAHLECNGPAAEDYTKLWAHLTLVGIMAGKQITPGLWSQPMERQWGDSGPHAPFATAPAPCSTRQTPPPRSPPPPPPPGGDTRDATIPGCAPHGSPHQDQHPNHRHPGATLLSVAPPHRAPRGTLHHQHHQHYHTPRTTFPLVTSPPRAPHGTHHRHHHGCHTLTTTLLLAAAPAQAPQGTPQHYYHHQTHSPGQGDRMSPRACGRSLWSVSGGMAAPKTARGPQGGGMRCPPEHVVVWQCPTGIPCPLWCGSVPQEFRWPLTRSVWRNTGIMVSYGVKVQGPPVLHFLPIGNSARPLLSGWLILYRGGGGWVGQRPKKSLCT